MDSKNNFKYLIIHSFIYNYRAFNIGHALKSTDIDLVTIQCDMCLSGSKGSGAIYVHIGISNINWEVSEKF